MRIYMINRYRERKRLARERFKNKCARCDSDEDLQFDHIDRKGKKFTIAKIWSYSEKKLLGRNKKMSIIMS